MGNLELKVQLETETANELMKESIELAENLKRALDKLNATQISISIINKSSTSEGDAEKQE